MNYIVNPNWFYYCQLISGIKTVMLTLSIFSSAGLLIAIIVSIASYVEGYGYRNNLYDDGTPIDPDWKNYLLSKKFVKVLAPCVIFSVLATLLLPSKETLISMMIAKYATKENLGMTVESIKTAVDYIMNTIKEIKG